MLTLLKRRGVRVALGSFLKFPSFLPRLFIILLFSFVRSLPGRLPSPRPSVTGDTAHRSFRGSNCAASPRGLTAGTSLHDDSTIVEALPSEEERNAERDGGRRRGKRIVRGEGGERMIGMACTKFGSFSSAASNETRKTCIPRERDTSSTVHTPGNNLPRRVSVSDTP